MSCIPIGVILDLVNIAVIIFISLTVSKYHSDSFWKYVPGVSRVYLLNQTFLAVFPLENSSAPAIEINCTSGCGSSFMVFRVPID